MVNNSGLSTWQTIIHHALLLHFGIEGRISCLYNFLRNFTGLEIRGETDEAVIILILAKKNSTITYTHKKKIKQPIIST